MISFAILLLSVIVSAGEAHSQSAVCSSARSCSTLAATFLQQHYFSESTWSWSEGFWNNANSLEALVNYIAYAQDTSFVSVARAVFAAFPASRILSTSIYFDDLQWWGLAYVRLFEVLGDKSVLDNATAIFDFVQANAWDTTCRGGVWWNTDKKYKNAITNELYFALSSKLYLNTRDTRFLQAANAEWAWFNQSGMLNAQNLINDGLNLPSCTNNGGTTWTYNQGVVLSGLANLYSVTGNKDFVALGDRIIAAVTNTLVTSNGILNEPSQNLDKDSQQFKGIFMRYLKYWVILTKTHKWDQFLYNQYVSIMTRDFQSSNGTFGDLWQGPLRGLSSVSQSSVLDALTAAIM